MAGHGGERLPPHRIRREGAARLDLPHQRRPRRKGEAVTVHRGFVHPSTVGLRGS